MLLLATSLFVFFGTNTPADSNGHGIYAARFDTTSGVLSEPQRVVEAVSPGFLVMHPDGQTLYAVSEHAVTKGEAGGVLQAYRYDAKNGRLTGLNDEATGGGNLVHVAIDPAGRVAAVASYRGGYVASFPIKADGSLAPRASLIQQTGQPGPTPKRQDKPHPHSVTFSPDGRFLYVCDLGLDRIFKYRVNPATAELSPQEEIVCTPGFGPRHSKFTPNGRLFYVLGELNGTIQVFTADPATGSLTIVQTIGTLPPGFVGENTCAEIRFSPDDRFVYASNRGHDSLAVFARAEDTGKLSLVEIVPTGGKHPRNFALSPDGRWLICANRNSNNVTVFARDVATGRLTATGQEVKVPLGICVLFAP